MITSVQNERVKEFAKLQMKKYRDKMHQFIIEGEHLVEEALKHGEVVEIFSLEERENATQVSSEVMKKLSGLTTPPTVLAVCKMMDSREIKGNVLLLDGLQDPGNLGTIIRSAVAFGIDTIVASFHTVDVYNTKVLRSSEGMLFRMNYIVTDIRDFIKSKEQEMTFYTTDVLEGTSLKEVKVKKPFGLIVGNEGAGVSDEVSQYAHEKIHISMNPACESLNVAMATSILLHHFYE